MILDMKKDKWILITRIFLVIFYGVGVAGFLIPATHDLFQRLVPLNLIISTVLLFLFHQNWSLRQVAVFSALAFSGYFIEVIGVQTGIIFGDYAYGKALGLKIFGTPLLIGLNWLILIYCIYVLFPKINQKWYYPFSGAAMLVLYDVIMEPVAISTDMWTWERENIPVQNYIAWYLIALLMLITLKIFRVSYQNRLAPWLLIIQFVFFILLRFLL